VKPNKGIIAVLAALFGLMVAAAFVKNCVVNTKKVKNEKNRG